MTARQPRRARRRTVPAPTLPRPTPPVAPVDSADTLSAEGSEARAATTAAPRRPVALHHRQHHITKDYTYVHRDLLTILLVGLGVIAFIVAMSFVVK